MSPQPKQIVIVGGGIIGTCTAYYTSISPHFSAEKGDSIILVEATEVAGAASGKAGGLLALDWHGQATTSEYRLSMLKQSKADVLFADLSINC
jgi:glycine/D-amino acid oxidase-like deaminating enzyme